MMCSPEEFLESIRDYDFEKLLKTRNELKKSIKNYESQKDHLNQELMDPSPDVVNSMDKEYLTVVRRRLLDKYPEAYIDALDGEDQEKEIVCFIDRTIKKVWNSNLLDDYDDYYLLREDSLKCALYYHLRRKLSFLQKKYDIRIYPEFYVQDLKYRADLAIVKVDFEKETKDFRDKVENILALVELKFVGGNSQNVLDAVKRDVTKMHDYYSIRPDTQYYCGVIYEAEFDELKLIDKRSTNYWADGNLAILKAFIKEDYMWFEVENYNHMNEDIKD